MDKSSTVYVGLDDHRDSIDIALAEAGRDGDDQYAWPRSGDVAAQLLQPLALVGAATHGGATGPQASVAPASRAFCGNRARRVSSSYSALKA